MTNKEILEKAIQKATENNFKWGKQWLTILDNTDSNVFINNQLPAILYNHDFAKALWGEHIIETGDIEVINNAEFLIEFSAWQYHLQQMVIADDPIKYLGENI